MATPWKSELGTFTANVEGQPCMITVDLAAIAHGPLSSHPVRLMYTVELDSPQPNGLPSDADLTELDQLEKRLDRVLSKRGALLAARFYRLGTAVNVYYGSAEPQPPVAIKTRLAIQPPRIDDDPEWEMLLVQLAPDAWNRLEIQTRRRLGELARGGDDPHLPRPVEHTVAFGDRLALTEAAKELRSAGFDVGQSRADSEDWVLPLTREQTLVDMAPVLQQIIGIVAPHGGEYLGWGAPATKPPSRGLRSLGRRPG